jgi:hypothetical protein
MKSAACCVSSKKLKNLETTEGNEVTDHPGFQE